MAAPTVFDFIFHIGQPAVEFHVFVDFERIARGQHFQVVDNGYWGLCIPRVHRQQQNQGRRRDCRGSTARRFDRALREYGQQTAARWFYSSS
jgi:hypothetical protein